MSNLNCQGQLRQLLSSVRMGDRKSQTSEMVKSMVHGKPSRRSPSEPGIYDVFCWEQPAPNCSDRSAANRADGNSTRAEKVQHHEQSPHEQNNCPQMAKQQDHENEQVHPAATQYLVGKPKKHLKPHDIKKELYMYESVHIKRNLSVEGLQKGTEDSRPPTLPQRPKLDQNNPQEREIIEKRKSKINNFKFFTRDLPNSAFTTYYGRPAFQSYGRCNSSSQLKTHNVMPHRGENHPKVKQTYEGALLKGKKIKIEDHLPRKPLENAMTGQKKSGKQTSTPMNLPLQKPDLVNHVRFSQAKTQSDRKQAVPTTEQLRQELKQLNRNHSKRTTKEAKRKQKISKTALDLGDGLKFMNTRDHLIDLIESKKTRDSRVAYKVTQCYPEQAQQLISRTKTESDGLEEIRPAGIAYAREQPAENIIYRRY